RERAPRAAEQENAKVHRKTRHRGQWQTTPLRKAETSGCRPCTLAKLVAFKVLFVPSTRSFCNANAGGNVTSRNKAWPRLFARAGKCGEMASSRPRQGALAGHFLEVSR